MANMEIDPRGPRVAALITTVVLAVVLITGSVWLLAFQALVFAVASAFGLRYSPYGLLYRRLIRPRTGPGRPGGSPLRRSAGAGSRRGRPG